ncbi:copper amine oxidase N-terminal domain-containing protein [Paenibacillus donghaensis]|uniref:copper amine oxidase N-terminal domain-containing protein n=1 Tax=Paenibacillus donghaensis TaxID=414771 RepID=UPI0018835690|nr:copper amine oxidase N-terminal domain-containing protein [Paenibacillus donghaensis]MBE9913046.1 copper amine oxidase N-terminal domain-containing protein [Paenibacillus donghaensis]
MNFKKLTAIAVLAAFQTAIVVPSAGAESAVTVQTETIQGITMNAANSSDSTSKNAANSSDGTANVQQNNTAGVGDSSNSGDNKDKQKAAAGNTPTTTGETKGGDNGTSSADNSGKTEGTPANTSKEGENQGTANENANTGDKDKAEGENGQTVTTPEKSGTTTDATDAAGTEVQAGPDELILMMNSNKMYQDGKLYLAAQPMTVKNGVSYVAIRAMVERVGLKLTYDNKTQETIIIKDGNELRFKTNSNVYRVNGVATKMKGPAYQQKDVFMVPLTSITQALNIPYKVDQAGKRVIMTLSNKPVATFTVQPAEIYVGETQVTYNTSQSKASNGLDITDERWEGKEEVFQEVGPHTITHYVQDSNGKWSDPYSVTINVLKQNEPPVAKFTTDKDSYKMGEEIKITDLSTDDEDAIVNREWLNDRKAFFKPGPVTIRLIVTDKHGLTDEFQKTINITNETLYTEDEFNKLFTEIGGKFTFDGGSISQWNNLSYSISSEPATLIRSNSPEVVRSEGVLYRETASGKTRFMIHHVNATGRNMKIYVIATNKSMDQPSQITMDSFGLAGPDPHPELTGKVSVERYFQSMQNHSVNQVTRLEPGESKVIMTDVSKNKLKKDDTISVFADAVSDNPIEYTFIMIDDTKDPLQTLPYLTNLDRDVHNRGTYPDSVRLIRYDESVGSTPARLILGDDNQDPNLKGTDGILGTEASNAGNFGVLYKITLSHVAPRTLITLNPRGGLYKGVLTVNGQIVQASNNSTIYAPDQAGVLYRTGYTEESVEIIFTPAPGSFLPVNLLLTPLPQMK